MIFTSCNRDGVPRQWISYLAPYSSISKGKGRVADRTQSLLA